MELRKAIGKEKIFSEMKVQLQNTQGRIASSEILIKDIKKNREKNQEIENQVNKDVKWITEKVVEMEG